MSIPYPYEELRHLTVRRAKFKGRAPEPFTTDDEFIVVSASDVEATIANKHHTGVYPLRELHVYNSVPPGLMAQVPSDQPDSEVRAALVARLMPYLDLTKGDLSASDMDICTNIYRKVSLVDRILRIEISNSWDYCAVAQIDWIVGRRRWIPIHMDAFYYQRDCVPPHSAKSGLIVTGEPYTGTVHLVLRTLAEDRYCCMLSLAEVDRPGFVESLPLANHLPILGESKDKEVRE